MKVVNGSPPSDCQYCGLRDLCVFGALDNGDVAEFKSVRGPSTSVAAGTVLCHEGEPADMVFTVYDGWVLKYRHAEDGGRHIVAVALPGDLVGEYADNWSTWQYSAETLTDAKLCRINRAKLVAFRQAHPVLAEATIRLARADERILLEHLLSITRRTAHDGIVHLLLEIYHRLRQRSLIVDGAEAIVPLTQEQIGDMLGLTTEYVNRRLREINSEGLITFQRKRLTVHDADQAAASVSFSPRFLGSENAG